jgi:hypothetical protein
MNATNRIARQIVKARRAAAKDSRKGLHTLASHARKAGLDEVTASSVAGALRSKTAVCGITGKAAVMVLQTPNGARLVRNARRFSQADFRTLTLAYAPRAPRFVAARNLILASV